MATTIATSAASPKVANTAVSAPDDAAGYRDRPFFFFLEWLVALMTLLLRRPRVNFVPSSKHNCYVADSRGLWLIPAWIPHFISPRSEIIAYSAPEELICLDTAQPISHLNSEFF